MTDYDLLDPGANWCPECGLPRGVCDCEDYERFVVGMKSAMSQVGKCAYIAGQRSDDMMTEQDYSEQFSGEDAPSAFEELADILGRFASANPSDYPGSMGVMLLCPDCDGVELDKSEENPCARCGGDGYLYPV